MKTATSPNLPEVAPSTGPKQDAKPDSQYVTVYTFYVYDHDQGKTVVYPRMATSATIAKMRGKMNEETAWVVDSRSLDIEGFYSGNDPAQTPTPITIDPV